LCFYPYRVITLLSNSASAVCAIDYYISPHSDYYIYPSFFFADFLLVSAAYAMCDSRAHSPICLYDVDFCEFVLTSYSIKKTCISFLYIDHADSL
jgi:hypothetical protein